MRTNKPKLLSFNPAVLPSGYVSPAADIDDDKYPRHYLIPGRTFAAKEPTAISTIVGSSVSVCLWDPITSIGGTANFLLPEDFEDDQNTKFGNNATRQLLQQMVALGADAERIQAKIFGGSEPATTFSSSTETLGHRNVLSALRFIASEKIRLVDQQTGGTNGRKIIFHTDNGSVWVRKL